MNFKNWNNVDKQPCKNTVFIAKLKNSEKFILGEILSEQGWLATPYLQIIYWHELKKVIDYWYDVKDIG